MRVLVFGDLHLPFGKKHYIDFLKETKKKFKCDTIVCLGDELDFHCISRHDSEPDAKGAVEEYELGLKKLKPFYKAFPKVKVCISNHTSRPYRMAAQVGIPSVFIKEYRQFLEAPKGWNWADQWEIDGVLYIHGEGYSGSTPHLMAAQKLRTNVVMGHIHHCGGVQFSASPRDRIFGMCCGCGIDSATYAFRYAKNTPKKPMVGCGVVIDGKHAYFEPMLLKNKIKRIGKIK